MTNDKKKEELRKEFDEFFWYDGMITTNETRRLIPFNRETVFDFFYQRIEEGDKDAFKKMQDALLVCQKLRYNDVERLSKLLKSQSEIIQAAHDLIRVKDEYLQLLCDELNELVPLAHVHGWKSTRHEQGNEFRFKIEKAIEKYNTLKAILPLK